MPALAKLRSERGRMSAMDRRIADYILANAQLLRDYSSQQLADALNVSQSSIVKFAQRLGYKGYPDLKISITESVARAMAHETASAAGDAEAARADVLWRSKTAAARETRGLTPPTAVEEAARSLAEAEMLFIAGEGVDGEAARSLAARMTLLGHRAIAQVQPQDLITSLSAAKTGDLLLVICGHGEGGEWLRACREMKGAGGRVLVLLRRTGKLSFAADACLLVAAHDPQPHVEDLVYEAAMRHLLDDLFLRIIAGNPRALDALVANRRRLRDGAAE
ncbi:MAG: MurR/RpiR family transcriptional regulator [Planctomycetes bacterium]|nr:MurR/RpiR family transcriptional regulator [Planctomycetota bacterium]